jgi:hypothetical protein
VSADEALYFMSLRTIAYHHEAMIAERWMTRKSSNDYRRELVGDKAPNKKERLLAVPRRPSAACKLIPIYADLRKIY